MSIHPPIRNDGRMPQSDLVPANDNAARRGDWMQTFTGRQAWPMDMRPEDVAIEDIAHSLSMQCRYGGHCLRFYSVAEHSVHVARYIAAMRFRDRGLSARVGLMHDATEAYVVDVPRPLKRFLSGYKDAETAVWAAVAARFAMPVDMPSIVHEVDGRILWDEQAQNMAPCHAKWSGAPAPLGIKLAFWSPAEAEIHFLHTFHTMFGEL
jgi:hypothetical protein